MKRPEYKRMYDVMKSALSGNLAQALFAVFCFNALQSLLCLLGALPLLLVRNGAVCALSTFVTILAAQILCVMLFAGVVRTAARISRGMNFSLGMIFRPLTEDARRTFLCALCVLCG